jgi:hypothetical protein
MFFGSFVGLSNLCVERYNAEAAEECREENAAYFFILMLDKVFCFY